MRVRVEIELDIDGLTSVTDQAKVIEALTDTGEWLSVSVIDVAREAAHASEGLASASSTRKMADPYRVSSQEAPKA